MKKLIVSALALTLISFASVKANTTEFSLQEKSAISSQQQEKVPVKPENLPEGIKKTIQGEEFAGWKVTSAFLVTAPDKTQYYELNVKNGSEAAMVKLDKNGKNVG